MCTSFEASALDEGNVRSQIDTWRGSKLATLGLAEFLVHRHISAQCRALQSVNLGRKKIAASPFDVAQALLGRKINISAVQDVEAPKLDTMVSTGDVDDDTSDPEAAQPTRVRDLESQLRATFPQKTAMFLFDFIEGNQLKYRLLDAWVLKHTRRNAAFLNIGGEPMRWSRRAVASAMMHHAGLIQESRLLAEYLKEKYDASKVPSTATRAKELTAKRDDPSATETIDEMLSEILADEYDVTSPDRFFPAPAPSAGIIATASFAARHRMGSTTQRIDW